MPKTLSRVVLPTSIERNPDPMAPARPTITGFSKILAYPGRNEDTNIFTGNKNTVKFASARWEGVTEIGLEDETGQDVINELEVFLALIADGIQVFIQPAHQPPTKISVRPPGKTENEIWDLSEARYIDASALPQNMTRTNPWISTNSGFRIRTASARGVPGYFRAQVPLDAADLLNTREAHGNCTTFYVHDDYVANGDGDTRANLLQNYTRLPMNQYFSAGGRLYIVVKDDSPPGQNSLMQELPATGFYACVQPVVNDIPNRTYIDRWPVLQCRLAPGARITSSARRGFFWGPWSIPWVEAP